MFETKLAGSAAPMRLFVAEKPSAAKALAAELGGPVTRSSGYLSCAQGARVTWCFGHILEMAMPEHYNPAWKVWRVEDLPIVPGSWKLRPRRETKQQLAIIGKLLKEASEVVNAGDPDREGQLLVDEVLDYFACKKPVRRFWVSAQDPVSIQRGLKALKDNAGFRGLRDAALARGRADWLIGINLSRAYTLQAQRADPTASVRTVGRVQTPTLALVVERDRAIEAFRPVPHYTLWVDLEHANGPFRAKWQAPRGQSGLDGEGRLLDPAVAAAVASKVVGQPGLITAYSQDLKTEGQPRAYALTRLTSDACARWGYTAEEVLRACQALYETHKLASYPRTDCEYLPESQHADASRVLEALRQVNPGLESAIAAADPKIRSKTWNDAKITAHHGIIPTMHVGDVSALTAIERNVYELIVRSYLAQFYLPHEYLHTSVTAVVAKESFAATGKVVTRNGWREVYTASPPNGPTDEEAPGQLLPAMQKGDNARCTRADRKDLKTKPPARFSEGSLQAAMENIYKFVSDPEERRILKEEDGIGTPATRATIIAELKRRGFIRPAGKHLESTELGRRLVDGLPSALKSPSLTALYERKLKDIEQGMGPLDAFLNQQEEFVNTQVAAANDGVGSATPAAATTSGPTCPACKEGVLRRIARKQGTGHFWGCNRYKSGCKATFEDKDGSPNLEKALKPSSEHKCPTCGEGDLRRIARKDGSGHFWGCNRFKSGCKATFEDKDGSPNFEKTPKPPSEHKCPTCGEGDLRRIARKEGSGHFWGCSRFKSGCKATFPDRAGVPGLPGTDAADPSSPTPTSSSSSVAAAAAASRGSSTSSTKGAQQ